jgi:hypothetical protein
MFSACERGLGTCWIGAFDETMVKEILEVREQLSPDADRNDTDSYFAAAREVARNRGLEVTEIRPIEGDPAAVSVISSRTGRTARAPAMGDGVIDPQRFPEFILRLGDPFLDRAALGLKGPGEHGSLPHFLQIVMVEDTLRGRGSTARDYLTALSRLDEGIELWDEMFDPIDATATAPEHFWPRIRDLFGADRGRL